VVLHDFIATYVIGAGDTDRCGVHELVAAIESRRPATPRDELEAACRDACVSLVEAGHVRVDMTPAGAERPGRDGYTPVARAEAIAVFRDALSWSSPADARPRYWLAATDAGRAAYISDEVVSL